MLHLTINLFPFIFQNLKRGILKEYMLQKGDPKFIDQKKRFEYLHHKLAHIKKLIIDYDQPQTARSWWNPLANLRKPMNLIEHGCCDNGHAMWKIIYFINFKELVAIYSACFMPRRIIYDKIAKCVCSFDAIPGAMLLPFIYVPFMTTLAYVPSRFLRVRISTKNIFCFLFKQSWINASRRITDRITSDMQS